MKPGILQLAAVACGAVGMIYALGIEGGAQIGQPISDGQFITAMVLILAAVLLGRLSFALEDAQKQARARRCGKIDRTHARTEEPEYRQNRRGA